MRRVRGCQCEAEVSVLPGTGHETHIGMSVCSQSLRGKCPRRLGGGDPALVSLPVGDLDTDLLELHQFHIYVLPSPSPPLHLREEVSLTAVCGPRGLGHRLKVSVHIVSARSQCSGGGILFLC